MLSSGEGVVVWVPALLLRKEGYPYISCPERAHRKMLNGGNDDPVNILPHMGLGAEYLGFDPCLMHQFIGQLYPNPQSNIPLGKNIGRCITAKIAV